ncbi:succinate dehydrogenase/fumarate reductase-like Fe-S protein [Paenibacillus castaneae]|uniref:hypothetical protein n=1 Tax=Paenibacillus castaneae TaxID=474957 RepID=UPI000C9B17BC|nr:hypothetical protein [Paenibacillus castaneae]NIK78251.1 succinate dehydrogenase/fumarate reductase-like Fe-S protein [Paenibacillus castaneae]
MMKEHTVYFKVIRGTETKLLTGLIFIEENTKPTLQDFEQCLKQCGHDVHIVDREHFIFQSNNANENYTIDVLENYKANTKDHMADNLAQSFMKHNPIL